MVVPFKHQGNPTLLYGNGRRSEIPGMLSGRKNVLVLTGNHFVKTSAWSELESSLKGAGVSYQRETVSGEPSPEVVDSLTSNARRTETDMVLAIGGGSVLDAGKAVAAMLCHEGSVVDYLEGVGSREPEGRTMPLIAVPTTAGTGSEATKNAVISRLGDDGFKKSLRHDAFIPGIALIDPELAVGCPPSVSLACGMDAFSQLLESFVSTAATPLTDMMARDGIRRFARGARLFAENRYGAEDESVDRGELALAAYFSGLTLANAGLGTVHGLAGPLGAICEIPHGAACGLLAPPAFRLLVEKLHGDTGNQVMEKLAWAGAVLSGSENQSSYGFDDIVRLLDLLEQRASALRRLSEFGIKESDLDAIVAGSGNKNFPVSLSTEERKSMLVDVL